MIKDEKDFENRDSLDMISHLKITAFFEVHLHGSIP
jgi:hypothetical protein